MVCSFFSRSCRANQNKIIHLWTGNWVGLEPGPESRIAKAIATRSVDGIDNEDTFRFVTSTFTAQIGKTPPFL
jgi:hypothetical protein